LIGFAGLIPEHSYLQNERTVTIFFDINWYTNSYIFAYYCIHCAISCYSKKCMITYQCCIHISVDCLPSYASSAMSACSKPTESDSQAVRNIICMYNFVMHHLQAIHKTQTSLFKFYPGEDKCFCYTLYTVAFCSHQVQQVHRDIRYVYAFVHTYIKFMLLESSKDANTTDMIEVVEQPTRRKGV